MGSEQLRWFKTLFTEDSSTEDVVVFLSKVFELEKAMGIDVVKSLEKSFSGGVDIPFHIDVKDGLFMVDYILRNLEDGNKNGMQVVESFVCEHGHLLRKYDIQVDALLRMAKSQMSNLKFQEIMHIFTVFEQKRNNQMLKTTDLCTVVTSVPHIIRSETLVAANLLNDLASLCITNPSKSEIKIQINGPTDVRVSIDTASMLHNIREGILRQPPDILQSLAGKTYNIEISNKLVRNVCSQENNAKN